MRVLMLGWEFPPFISGGLGTACYGLTKALSANGTDVIFVLPRPVTPPHSAQARIVAPTEHTAAHAAEHAYDREVTELRLDDFEHVSFRTVDAQGGDPYARPGDAVAALLGDPPAPQAKVVARGQRETSSTRRESIVESRPQPAAPPSTATTTPNDAPPPPNQAGGDLFGEVHRYGDLAVELAHGEQFDVIHAHDWMTFPAGLAVAAATGKPLVVHVHSTESDRSGANLDTRIVDIERRGMHAALKVIAVSHLTRNVCVAEYGVAPEKVEVVYNAIDLAGNGGGGMSGPLDPRTYDIQKTDKIVLFFGRITMQKGPEYFIAAAKKVLEVLPDVRFIMAGSGDMTRRTIELAAQMGIGPKVLFTGFLRGKDIDDVFKKADLYVMPSVSEPFGIAPLEAIAHDVPVIISKQSGVSEVLENVLKVDFWDVDEMANKIVSVLKRPALSKTLREHGAYEVRKLSWSDSAAAVEKVYAGVTGAMPKVAKATSRSTTA